MLHSELKSKRWPWLTEGWEVAEEVDLEKLIRFWSDDLLGIRREPLFSEPPSRVYRPADRIAFSQNGGSRSTT